MIAPSAISMIQNSVEASRSASLLAALLQQVGEHRHERRRQRRVARTGCATRFGTWKAIVNADAGAAGAEEARERRFRARAPRPARRPCAIEKIAVLRATPRPLADCATCPALWPRSASSRSCARHCWMPRSAAAVHSSAEARRRAMPLTSPRPGAGASGPPARVVVSGVGQGRYSTALRGAAAFLRARRPSAMANIHSQKKRILRSERERLENRRYTSTIKTYFRRLESARRRRRRRRPPRPTHRELVSTIDKAVKRGALHQQHRRAQEVPRARRTARRRQPLAALAARSLRSPQRERVLARSARQRRAAARRSGAPPRESSSRSASAPSAARRRSGSLRATSAMKRSAARGGMRSAALDLRGRLARLQALRDRERVAQPLSHQVDQARTGARPARAGAGRTASPRARRPPRARRRARRRATRPSAPRAPRSPRRRSLRAAPRASPSPSSASFSSSRSSRCWRSPTCATSALAAAASSVRPRRARLLARPLGELPRLDRHLRDDLPAGALDRRRAAPPGAFARASSRANSASVVSGGICAIAGSEMLLDVRLAPALDAFDDDHAPADRERHRGERRGDARRRRLRRPRAARRSRRRPSAFGERAQPRAALGDRAVVVAVDQVGGLELGGHGVARAQRTHEVDELAGHDDLLDDLLAVDVRLHVRRRQAELLELLGARRRRAACTRSRTLPLTWQTSS